MKKILVCLLAGVMLAGLATSASAHGGRGGYYYYGGHGGGWRGGWAPFAVGAVAGVAVANAYYRPAHVYYAPQYVYPPQPQAAAYCPENGLYYPQTQACPSGWQRVNY
ncbi:hypothetical protein ICN48_12045 [Polynucleobacter sp. JS-Safj-400b-B2]|uniref:hypothetical protein n=1 Tax=Polynucleobacter sp. JS-Safj-400b-B2 TaxID=2576921 RepID=UPI001C0CFE43|nr:hypothetical protein [Polynucleobacter sp. JS-Safj-400b-B2]MBU3626960.1 hypothetical protein [Polynucleobacter sp. JS-Safj-400b-B2]